MLCQRASGGEKVSPRFEEFLLDAVALAALGLVADVVPLHDENRVYRPPRSASTRRGPTVGLKALLEAAGLAEGETRAGRRVGFRLAPRLNAAGRLGCARLVVELLTTPSPQRAGTWPPTWNRRTSSGRQIERKIAAQAREMAQEGPHRDDPALVLADADWHAGVIGIVAGPAGRAARPAGAAGGAEGRRERAPVAAGRCPGFALHEALAHCDGHLLSHGGTRRRPGSASCRIASTVPRSVLCLRRPHFPDGPPPPTLILDAEVPLSALTPGLIAQIDRLEPYGSRIRGRNSWPATWRSSASRGRSAAANGT